MPSSFPNAYLFSVFCCSRMANISQANRRLSSITIPSTLVNGSILFTIQFNILLFSVIFLQKSGLTSTMFSMIFMHLCTASYSSVSFSFNRNRLIPKSSKKPRFIRLSYNFWRICWCLLSISIDTTSEKKDITSTTKSMLL